VADDFTFSDVMAPSPFQGIHGRVVHRVSGLPVPELGLDQPAFHKAAVMRSWMVRTVRRLASMYSRAYIRGANLSSKAERPN
jgi:hypothetical protein